LAVSEESGIVRGSGPRIDHQLHDRA
jgi:hypothetical protein